jgi:hypothetical protein
MDCHEAPSRNGLLATCDTGCEPRRVPSLRFHFATPEETPLMLNGLELAADVDEQERLMLDLAAGRRSRDALLACLEITRAHGCSSMPPDSK